MPDPAKKAVSNGLFDEGHVRVISQVMSNVRHLSSWLTTEQAQIELTKSILDPHRGGSEGKKPTVDNVRKRAAEWKEMIAEAETYFNSLKDEAWQQFFVKQLVDSTARTKSVVVKCMTATKNAIGKAARLEEECKRAEASEAERKLLLEVRQTIEWVGRVR